MTYKATLLVLMVLVNMACTKNNRLSSPDRHIKVSFTLQDGNPVYSLMVGDKTPILNANLGLKLAPGGGCAVRIEIQLEN